jgi:arylsulfatase A-like enzyme
VTVRRTLLQVVFLAVGASACGTLVAAEPSRRPNILHIHADDHRADGLHALGTKPLVTPHLDALVARGTTFTRCYTMGSMIGAVCTPSRTMMLTGRSWQRIPGAPAAAANAADPATFLPKVLAAAGYQTWHMGKPGNAFTAGIRAFETNIEDAGHGAVPGTDRAHASSRLADRTIDFLEQRTKGSESRPFYIYLAPPVPHDPRSAEPRFHAMYDPEKIPLPAAFLPQHPFDNGEMLVRDEKLAPWPRTSADTRRQLADYYACITGLDHHVGRILAALEASGQLENTIVIFSADNGLSMGEHGLFGKQNLYEFGGMHVPLVVAGPGIPQRRSDALVYLTDLFSTLVDYAGAHAPDGVEGRSLRPVVEGRAAGVRDVLVTAYRDCMRAISDGRWKLIRYPLVDRTQLFDLSTDPHELVDLAGRPEHAATVAKLMARLEREMTTLADPHLLRVERPQPADWRPPSLDDHRGKVRTGTWTERWPDAAGVMESRSVTAEVWTEAMQAALDRDGLLHIPARAEPYYIDGPLVMTSFARLTADPQAEIRLVPGTNTCMVRNAGLVGFSDRPVPAGTKPDAHIEIEGGIWTTLATSRQESNGNLRGASAKADPVHGTHGVILLHNVRDVAVRNVTVRQSRPFAVHLGNVRDFVVEGVSLDRHGRDGVHVSGPASDGAIRRVSGDSQDDPVAFTAWDWKNYAPSYGPIHDVLVEDVTGAAEGKDAHNIAIRLLPGVKRFADGTLLDCPIRDITLRRITDIQEYKFYDQPNLELGRDVDASESVGRLENIRLEGLVFNRPGAIEVHADTSGLAIDGVEVRFAPAADWRLVRLGPKSQTYKHTPADPATWTEIFSPDRDCTIRGLEITGVRDAAGRDLPGDRLVEVIEQRPNPDYPRTLPRGGTGRAIWVR